MLKLYENIKNLRKENGWSQEELAKKMGYTDRSSIAKIESGKVDLSQSKIMEFAKVFGVEPGDLMGWEEPSNEPKIMMIGGNARYLPVFAESDDIEKALELYKAYSDASSDVQSAIEILLKSHLSDS